MSLRREEPDEELSPAMFARLTQATRVADELFESGRTGGGGTRHWLRDCFLPALKAVQLRIVDDSGVA